MGVEGAAVAVGFGVLAAVGVAIGVGLGYRHSGGHGGASWQAARIKISNRIFFMVLLIKVLLSLVFTIKENARFFNSAKAA